MLVSLRSFQSGASPSLCSLHNVPYHDCVKGRVVFPAAVGTPLSQLLLLKEATARLGIGLGCVEGLGWRRAPLWFPRAPCVRQRLAAVCMLSSTHTGDEQHDLGLQLSLDLLES